MERQFRITGYTSNRDFDRKHNGITFTNIDELLRFINKSRYYNALTGEEVEPTEDWHYSYKSALEDYGGITDWDIEEYPTDNTVRIIGVESRFTLTQRTGKTVYDSLNDPLLTNIPHSAMKLYPYTMTEFLCQLRAKEVKTDFRGRADYVCPLPYNEYDFIALLHI